MSDLLNIDVDATDALRMLDALGEAAERYAKEAAMETAAAIDDGATARVRRRQGITAQNIVHTDHLPEYLGGSPSFNKTAAFVYVEPIRRPDNLTIWLNFGTKYMSGDDFLFAAARLEEGNHLRRLGDKLQDACDEVSR